MSLFAMLVSASIELSDNLIEIKSRNKQEHTIDATDSINEEITITTQFKDQNLIENALISYGLKINDDKRNLGTILENGSIKFEYNGLTYDMTFTGSFDKNEAQNIYENIKIEYGKMIQEDTYNKVIERLKKMNMNLENESITNDDSIVLTVNI
ncbi:MAG: hypothetical protein BZ136_08020 [Methanosphaera sp. rholeuAM74]|nr:MAG: hypothetical protein BZ136_08020 [Methanosphaera sp. rholeuAM74]